MNKNIILRPFLIFGFSLLIWLIFPVVSILIFFILLSCNDICEKNRLVFLVLISSTLGIINSTKIPVSDLQVYYNLYKEFNEISIIKYWQIKILDPFFYLPTSVLSHLFDGYPPTFIFFWTVATYFLLGYSVIGISSKLCLNNSATSSLLIFAMLFGYSFSLQGHMVRQYAAMSILLISISYLLQGKKYYYIFIIAVLTHFSSVIFLPAFFKVDKFFYCKAKFIYFIATLFVIFYFLGTVNYFEIINFQEVPILELFSTHSAEYVHWTSAGIYMPLLVEYIFLYIIFIFLYVKNKSQDKIGSYIFLFLSTYFMILILFRNTGIMLERYFFYGPIIPIISLPYMFSRLKSMQWYLGLLLALISIFYFFRIFLGSPFFYISNNLDIILLNFYDYLFYIIKFYN